MATKKEAKDEEEGQRWQTIYNRLVDNMEEEEQRWLKNQLINANDEISDALGEIVYVENDNPEIELEDNLDEISDMINQARDILDEVDEELKLLGYIEEED